MTDGAGPCCVVERAVELSDRCADPAPHPRLEAEIVAARQTAGDTNLHLLHGPDLFGPDDVDDLPDGLHPNAAGYQRMGERFHTLVFEDGPFRA